MKLLAWLKPASENSRIVAKNVLGAFIIKGLSIIISFATTPLFIHYFHDNEVLGIWYTLLSVLLWFLNFDLGIGNGIRNNLVRALTSKDFEKAKSVISSGMFSVGLVTILLSILGCISIFFVNLNWLFNVNKAIISSHTLLLSASLVFIAIMLRFFLTTITSVFYALQKSAINNFLALCVSILQLLYVVIFKFSSPEDALINISFAYLFLSNFPVVVAGIIVFCKDLRHCTPSIRYIKTKHIKAIISIGSVFFVCQILYMIIANTNEFFVTHLYGAEYTADYTFYYKLATLGTLVVSLALTPVWSVVTKAQTEGNYVWLQKLYKYIKLGGFGIFAIQLLLVPFIPFLMNLWLGKNVLVVNNFTSLAFALYGAIFMYSGMLSTIANGLALMKAQTISYIIAVILKLLLLLTLYRYTNWNFVVWVNVLIFIPYIIIQQISLNRYLAKQTYLTNSSC
jgi:putative O-antigen export protein